jgi:hypothetical protein
MTTGTMLTSASGTQCVEMVRRLEL